MNTHQRRPPHARKRKLPERFNRGLPATIAPATETPASTLKSGSSAHFPTFGK